MGLPGRVPLKEMEKIEGYKPSTQTLFQTCFLQWLRAKSRGGAGFSTPAGRAQQFYMAKNVDTRSGELGLNDASFHREMGQREVLGFPVPLFQITNKIESSTMRAPRREAKVSLSTFTNV